jgi:hypothetical protein
MGTPWQWLSLDGGGTQKDLNAIALNESSQIHWRHKLAWGAFEKRPAMDKL